MLMAGTWQLMGEETSRSKAGVSVPARPLGTSAGTVPWLVAGCDWGQRP